MNIRPAVEADAATIKRMVSDERLDPTGLKWQNFLVAEDGGQIVGIGQIRRYGGIEELGSLVVLPASRGQGIGGQLIGALEVRAGRPLYLFTRDLKQSYYERFGYRRISFADAPTPLRLKFLIPSVFRIFGLRIIMMRKD